MNRLTGLLDILIGSLQNAQFELQGKISGSWVALTVIITIVVLVVATFFSFL